MKSTLQESYQCIFEFDTYTRKINIRAASSNPVTKPAYFSFNNLLKDVEIEEDSENISTCLSVYGADGVDIRSVNPMGNNKIYDFSYFMNTSNFTQDFINKHNSWKAALESKQLPYYNLAVEHALKMTEVATQNAALADLKGELKNLKNQQAVTIQAIAMGVKNSNNTINSQITQKNNEIAVKNTAISTLQSQAASMLQQMAAINQSTALTAFFTADELKLLDKFIKEDSIEESSFVAPAVKTYSAADSSSAITNTACSVTSARVSKTVTTQARDIYTVSGGNLTVGSLASAEIIKASFETGTDRAFLFTAYLKSGVADGVSFPSGCMSMTGTISAAPSSDVAQNAASPGIMTGTRLSFNVSSARYYFTQNTTIYEQRSVEWDLYDYGKEVLAKVSKPKSSFSASMANFLALEEFAAFKREVALGSRVYLRVDEGGVLAPIVVKCIVDYEKPENFTFAYSSTYDLNDSEFLLADLLQQSVSMGSKVDTSQFTYNAWIESGANTAVAEFMQSALDVARNEILSSSGQAFKLDETGFRLMKEKSGGWYEPFQIWMNNGMIMFTNDAWKTANLAIGQIKAEGGRTVSGVVADALVGKLLAGNNMIIESATKSNGKSVFRVDGGGASLYNASFSILQGTNEIVLDATHGIAIGKSPLYTAGGAFIKDNASFWVDSEGNIHMKGVLEAASGTFSGALNAATGTFKGDISGANGTFTGTIKAKDYLDSNNKSMMTNSKFKSDYLDLLGLTIRKDGVPTLTISNDGSITMSGSIKLGPGSTIDWGSGVTSDPALATLSKDITDVGKKAADATKAAGDATTAAQKAQQAVLNLDSTISNTYIPNMITSAQTAANEGLLKLVNGTYVAPSATFITGKEIKSPTIIAGTMSTTSLSAVAIGAASITGTTITGGTIKGTKMFCGKYFGTLEKSYMDIVEDTYGKVEFIDQSKFKYFSL
ncbi:MAG: DUF3672 domain-containing protein, partial [Clostridiales bacterium]|nr:DUF3672 domain-containing protein [Clostridiales bacterium]